MKTKSTYYDSRPVAIYNTDKKELIGIFSKTILVCSYLFDIQTHSNTNSVYNGLRKKYKIHGTIFDFKVAIRYANEIQIDMLEGEDYKIMEGYIAPTKSKMQGFIGFKKISDNYLNNKNK